MKIYSTSINLKEHNRKSLALSAIPSPGAPEVTGVITKLLSISRPLGDLEHLP